MPDLTLKAALADQKYRPVLTAWSRRIFMDENLEFILDVRANKRPLELYERYIANDSPRMVNLPSHLFRSINDIFDNEVGDSPDLRKLMADAHDEIFNLLNDSFISGSTAFAKSPEYQTFQAGSLTTNEHVQAALSSLALPAPKAKLIEPLIDTYLKARTPSDAYEAYEAMQKIAPKTRVDPALTAAGKPAAEVVTAHEKAVEAAKVKKLAEANAKKAAALVPTLKTDVAAALKYLESALKATKDKAKFKTVSPAEKTRMFNSGRLRVEKVTSAYTKAVTYDKAFATKNPVLAASKKKMDEQWGEYREAIGK